MEFLQEDCKSIWSHIQHEENQLKMKRRWLMGLPTISKSEQKHLKTPKFLKNVYLPESLLREDDVSYDIVRTSVESGFGASSVESGHHVVQDYLQLFDTNELLFNIRMVLPSMLDNMNNIGLCRLANIATGSSVKFEKTRWRMKKVIKEYLPKILRNPNHQDHIRLLTHLPQLLKDPCNFRENRVILLNSTPASLQCAATEVVKTLEDMPFQTLSAMHKKLKGVEGGILRLQSTKPAWSQVRLVELVRKTCKKMLSELDEGDELQKPLAKAMAVAALSLKLTTENPNLSVPEFCHFSPEIEALQNEILKAIWFLKEMNIGELKDLQRLLDPKAQIPNAHVRAAIRRMLTEYLFECSEMDIIPKPLLETLTIIRSLRNVATICLSKKDREEEVENVLCVSSQIRQIAWDLLPNHKIDEEFTDAYMEDSEESDDDQRVEPNYFQIGGSSSSDEAESSGESRPVDYVLPTTTTNGNGSSLLLTPNRNLNSNSIEGSEPERITDPGLRDLHGLGSSSSPSCQESSFRHEAQNTSGNQYLAIQEICDDTSLAAHRLIGGLLEEFLQIEGVNLEKNEKSYLRGGISIPEDSQGTTAKETQGSSKEDVGGPLLVKVVEEVLPSFPKSGIERIKELMGQQ